MNNKRLFKGIIIGTLLPLIFGLLIKIIFYDYVTFAQILEHPKLMSPFLQWGIIANLLIFYIFMVKNKNEEQRGVVLPTMIYALLAMLLKYYF